MQTEIEKLHDTLNKTRDKALADDDALDEALYASYGLDFL